MHPDELAERVERELKANPSPKLDEPNNELDVISSAVESVVQGFNPVIYRDSYSDSRTLPYIDVAQNYFEKFERSREDMSSRVPLKWLNIMPKSQMGGVLGFTHFGGHFNGQKSRFNRRDGKDGGHT